MKRIILFVVLATLTTPVLRLGASPQVDANGDKQLAAAKHKARDDGDVSGAIAMYQLIADNAGANRALAAQALLGMAECYETLGKPEARATYERVLTDYAANSAAAAAARTRLAAMDQKSGGLIARQLPDWVLDRVSPDGRYLTFSDWGAGNGNLAIRDLASGKVMSLTSDATPHGAYADGAIPSPDSRLIAYGWQNEMRPHDLRVISRDGGRPRVVYPNDEGALSITPFGWSPDGRSILAIIDQKDFTRDLVVVSVAGGAPRLVKHFDSNLNASGFSVSPDGRIVAYGLRAAQARPEHDLFCVSLDSGAEVPLLRDQADDYVLGWFPDGGRVLFGSDRGGSDGLWALRVANGRAEGEPTVVQHDTGHLGLMNNGILYGAGFTQKGDLYYRVLGKQEEVHLATLDPVTGRMMGPLTTLEGRFIAHKRDAMWSPDGSQIAYVQSLSDADKTDKLVVQTIATGAALSWTVALQNISNPVWLSDGSPRVLIEGRDLEGRPGVHMVNADTGVLTTVVPPGAADNISARDAAVLSRDGQRVFFVWRAAGTAGVGVRDLTSGTEQRLMTITGRVSGVALSPDGRWLAVTELPRESDVINLRIIPASGGDALPVVAGSRVTGGGGRIAWTADSRSVFVVTRIDEPGLHMGVRQVFLDGTQPRDTGINFHGDIRRISISPDGRRLAVSASSDRPETWVLQNIPGQRVK